MPEATCVNMVSGTEAETVSEAQVRLRREGTVIRQPEQLQPPSTSELEFFDTQGFLLCPGLLSPSECQTVAAGVDEAVARRPGGYHKRNAAPLDAYIPTSIPALGALVTHHPTMAMMHSLMNAYQVITTRLGLTVDRLWIEGAWCTATSVANCIFSFTLETFENGAKQLKVEMFILQGYLRHKQ